MLCGLVLAAAACEPVETQSVAPDVRETQDAAEVWRVPLPGQLPLTVVADEQERPYVYVAAKNGGLLVIDSTAGQKVATLGVDQFGGSDVMHLDQQGPLLAVALGDFFASTAHLGVALVDVAQPDRPEVIGLWRSSTPRHGAADIVIDGDTVFLAAMEEGVLAFDITDPAAPAKVGEFRPDPDFPTPNPGAVALPNARGLAIDDTSLYVAYDAGGLRVLDVADPAAMREVGRHINPDAAKQQAYNDVLLWQDLAFASLDYCGLEVIDRSDPSSPTQVAWLDPWNCNSLSNLWFNSPGHLNELAFDSARQIVWVSAGDSELVAVDVARPSEPKVLEVLGEPGNGLAVYGLGRSGGDEPYVVATYITAVVPFRGTTAAVVAYDPG